MELAVELLKLAMPVFVNETRADFRATNSGGYEVGHIRRARDEIGHDVLNVNAGRADAANPPPTLDIVR